MTDSPRFIAIPTEAARHYRSGGLDAHGQAPERTISDGSGNPCRHCLGFVPEGAGMLILAHRPFPELQPYAETGPIFLCSEDCARWEGEGLPPIFTEGGEERLIKGYSPENRIVYGTGRIVPPGELADAAAAVLDDPRVAYVHVRSSRNNCYTCRFDLD